jgi:chemotaxis protein methyltransferase CheR
MASSSSPTSAFEAQLSDRDFARLAKCVYDHCGITMGDNKRELAKSRLAKRLRVCGLNAYSDYLDRVLAHPQSDEFGEMIDALSTNLTSFFRENDHFEYLADHLLPEIVKRRTADSTKRIRCWSAASSTGEEPYTLAIVLNEVLPKLNATRGWDVKMLATDISTRVLKKARAGVYEMDRVKTVSPQLRGKYFEPRTKDGEPHLAVSSALRSMVVFNHLNLMDSWPFTGPMDFIFCRNVMIYFDKPTQERLVERFYQILSPGGVLFTGHSESLTGVKHRFGFIKPTIYSKPE